MCSKVFLNIKYGFKGITKIQYVSTTLIIKKNAQLEKAEHFIKYMSISMIQFLLIVL